MRVPLSWLADYVDLPGDVTPESVMAELVKVGLEEEGSHRFEVSGPVVVGQVLEFVAEPQSNGKTIRWCQVRVAETGENQVRGQEAQEVGQAGEGQDGPRADRQRRSKT